MILPMMGFLFTLTLIAAAWFITSSVIGRLRPLRPFALVPLVSALLAFAVCWGAAISLEAAFGEAAGGTGLFAGYVSGGVAGALLGYVAAQRVRHRVSPRDANDA